jgi:carboxyl-terminal processing protease
MTKKFTYFVWLVVFAAAAFWSGTIFEKSRSPVCPPQDVDLSLFWQTWRVLEEKFVKQEELEPQKMIYGAIKGMVASLGDPYTVFLNPEDAKKFLEDVSGSFEGVGMEIGIRKGQLQIVAPLEGTPAQEAGLRAGDKIMKIDDASTADITVDQAVSLIRGPKGTEVRLTILRDEWDKTKEFKLVRAVINIPSLKLEIKEGNIAYLRLYGFTEKARSDFAGAVFQILNSPAKKIILDLRNNPGGYLEVAQDIAGWFLERGQLVAIENFGGSQKEYKAQGTAELLTYPLLVLVDQGSASGAEILAAALRDNRGVKLLGEKTFGKGSVQQIEQLKGGSSLKVTVATWLSPKGELINDKGLQPDIEIKMTDDDYEADRDPQLLKALEIMKEM